MKKIISLVLASAMVLSMAACSSSSADKKEEETVINIQFVPTNTEGVDAATADFEAYFENILGVDVNVTVATDYSAITSAMESGQVDVGIMPPAAYVQARSVNAAESILSSTLIDYDQTTELPIEGSSVGSFKAEVLVKADADIDSYEDLAGKKIAFLGASSASGYIYPVAEMKEAGVEIVDENFVQITDVTSAMKAVLNGQVDACFVFEGARYVFREAILDDAGNPVDLFTELKVARLSDGDIPNDAIAVLPTMDDEMKTAIKDAFLQMASDTDGLEIMKSWNHTGYVESDETAYDTIEDYIARATGE